MVSMLQKLIYFSGFLKEDKYMVRVCWGEGVRLQSKTLMPAAVAVAVVRFLLFTEQRHNFYFSFQFWVL